MSPGRHSLVTTAQREELWRRNKAGETMLGIAHALGQGRNNLYRVLEAIGGIAPRGRSGRRTPCFAGCSVPGGKRFDLREYAVIRDRPRRCSTCGHCSKLRPSYP